MLKYSIVTVGDATALTLFHDGEIYTATSDSHPNWDTILHKALAGDASVVDDFDTAKFVARKFVALTERASVSNGTLFYDGDEMDTALSRQVLRFLDAGVDDWRPLVKFLDNVMQNPSEHSRTQLFEWLNRKDFGINAEGEIVGYKSVFKQDDGTYRPTRMGPGIVDGVEVADNDYIVQRVGSVVEMPRSSVVHDPRVGCSVGLHVSNYDYAASFSGNAILRVAVNPRDVVSVPTECNWDKMRVSRYRVVEANDKETYKYDESEVYYANDDDEDYCEGCGNHVDDCECSDDNGCAYCHSDKHFGACDSSPTSISVNTSDYEPKHSDYRYAQRGPDGKFVKKS